METELKALGLSHYESKALNVLLSEKLNLRQISSKTTIPFGKVYSIVKSLREKGLVKETNSRPKLVYVENASEIISSLIEVKKKKDGEMMETLKQYVSRVDKDKGNVTVFFEIGTTAPDNKKIQLRTFLEAKNEILQIINIHHKPRSNRGGKTVWEKAVVQAVENGILFKAIYPKNVVLPPLLERLHTMYPRKFQVRRFDTDFVRCDIIDSDKVLIKLVQQDPLQFGGVLFIEDQKLNDNLKKIFYEMWETAIL